LSIIVILRKFCNMLGVAIEVGELQKLAYLLVRAKTPVYSGWATGRVGSRRGVAKDEPLAVTSTLGCELCK
jgi:hypothetical protein